MEKRIKSSIAGTSVFSLLGHNYMLIKRSEPLHRVLGKHLAGRNLGASVKQPLLVSMWKTDMVPPELPSSRVSAGHGGGRWNSFLQKQLKTSEFSITSDG